MKYIYNDCPERTLWLEPDAEPNTYEEPEELYHLTIWLVDENDNEIEIDDYDWFKDDDFLCDFNERAKKSKYFDTKKYELVDWDWEKA